MKLSAILFCITIFIISSCNNSTSNNSTKANNATGSANETPVIAAAKPVIDTNHGDPAFVMPRDTVSTYGPRSITRNVLQDKNGNYWFASWEGIICYDGKLFTNFTLKEGLRHYHVFSLLEDKAGNLWFGTIGGGVYRYDGKYFTLFTTKDHLAGDAIMCMMQDRAGNIWFGTGGNGVSRYDGSTFISFSTQDGLSNNFVSCISQDKTGKIWFGTDGGISFYEPSALPGGQAGSLSTGGKSFTDFTHKENVSFHRVRSIIEDKNGNIWIGSQEGLYHYDPSASLMTGGKSLTNVKTSYTSIIFEDKTGNLWLNDGGTDNHKMVLYRYDPSAPKAGFTEIVVNKDTRATFLNQIFGIIQDRDGSIWFGTASGACRYNGKSINDFTQNMSKR